VNARIAKFDANGRFIKSWGSLGTAPGQFNVPHSVVTDVQGNVYVADRENRRIQVFDNNGAFKTQFINVGTPWTLCMTPGPRQYLYSSNSNDPREFDRDGEIYKLDLDGRIVGRFGRAGRLLKEFSTAHGIDCRSENQLYVGELTSWRVQKLLLQPGR
jgi:DNA-binding beta-propeller fold protein YncE